MLDEQSPWARIPDFSNWQAVIDELGIKPYPIKKGTIILHQGSSDEKIYVIENGRVNLSVADAQGDEKCLFILGRGCAFGEISLLCGSMNRATATAMSHVTMYEVPGGYVRETLYSNAALNKAIVENLLTKTNLLTSQVELLCFFDSSYRVIENIYYLMNQFGKQDEEGGILIEMRFTHQEMANLVGTSRVTVTNIFLNLEREGFIEKHKKGIYVKNPGRFREYIKAKRETV